MRIDETYPRPFTIDSLVDVSKFVDFVKSKHAGQPRRDGSDYFGHCQGVAVAAEEICKSYDIDVYVMSSIVAAAYGHDLFEDTRTDYEDVQKVAGDAVASLISWVSDDKRMPSYHRHILYRQRLRAAPLEAKIVKLADLYDNGRDALKLAENLPDDIERRRKDVKFLRNWCRVAMLEIATLLETSKSELYIAAATAIGDALGIAENEGLI